MDECIYTGSVFLCKLLDFVVTTKILEFSEGLSFPCKKRQCNDFSIDVFLGFLGLNLCRYI